MSNSNIPASPFTIAKNVVSGALPGYYANGGTPAGTYKNVLFYGLAQAGNTQDVLIEFCAGDVSITSISLDTTQSTTGAATPMLGSGSVDTVNFYGLSMFAYNNIPASIDKVKISFQNNGNDDDITIVAVPNSPQPYGLTTAYGPLNTIFGFTAEDTATSKADADYLDAQVFMIWN